MVCSVVLYRAFVARYQLPSITTSYHMTRYIQIAELTVSLLLVAAILLQNRGAGLGGAFGGEGNVYRTKRGVEKGLFVSTIVLGIILFGLALTNLVVS